MLRATQAWRLKLLSHAQKTESNLQAKRRSGRYLNVHEAMEVNDPSCPFLQVEEHQDFLL